MKASVAMLGHMWDKGRKHVGQGQDTCETRVGKWDQWQGTCGARAGNMVEEGMARYGDIRQGGTH